MSVNMSNRTFILSSGLNVQVSMDSSNKRVNVTAERTLRAKERGELLVKMRYVFMKGYIYSENGNLLGTI